MVADHLAFTRERHQSFISEINRLLELDFPYQHSSVALEALKSYFEQRGTVLASFDSNSDPAVVRQNCMLILRDFVIYLPLLGFILRSTDVRNAFEVFGPLLRLARQVLRRT